MSLWLSQASMGSSQQWQGKIMPCLSSRAGYTERTQASVYCFVNIILIAQLEPNSWSCVIRWNLELAWTANAAISIKLLNQSLSVKFNSTCRNSTGRVRLKQGGNLLVPEAHDPVHCKSKFKAHQESRVGSTINWIQRFAVPSSFSGDKNRNRSCRRPASLITCYLLTAHSHPAVIALCSPMSLLKRTLVSSMQFRIRFKSRWALAVIWDNTITLKAFQEVKAFFRISPPQTSKGSNNDQLWRVGCTLQTVFSQLTSCILMYFGLLGAWVSLC